MIQQSLSGFVFIVCIQIRLFSFSKGSILNNKICRFACKNMFKQRGLKCSVVDFDKDLFTGACFYYTFLLGGRVTGHGAWRGVFVLL